MSAYSELSTMQKVRLDVTTHLINTGRYDQFDTENLIANTTEIVNYIESGKYCGCDSSQKMKVLASSSGL